MCPFINFFPVVGTNKIIFLTSILNNINQYLVILGSLVIIWVRSQLTVFNGQQCHRIWTLLNIYGMILDGKSTIGFQHVRIYKNCVMLWSRNGKVYPWQVENFTPPCSKHETCWQTFPEAWRLHVLQEMNWRTKFK